MLLVVYGFLILTAGGDEHNLVDVKMEVHVLTMFTIDANLVHNRLRVSKCI